MVVAKAEIATLGINYKTETGGSDIKRRKSWLEKLANSKGLPKVVKIDDKMSKR
jgi:hypothetical protein